MIVNLAEWIKTIAPQLPVSRKVGGIVIAQDFHPEAALRRAELLEELAVLVEGVHLDEISERISEILAALAKEDV